MSKYTVAYFVACFENVMGSEPGVARLARFRAVAARVAGRESLAASKSKR